MIHWFKNRQTKYPKFYQRYLEKIKDEGFSKVIISLDMETTSIDVSKAEVMSFGSLTIHDHSIIAKSEYHEFYKVDNTSEESSLVHEILDQSMSKRFEDDIETIIHKISNNQILGHYVVFDIALINKQLKEMSLPKLKNPKIDTLDMALKKDAIRDLSTVSRESYSLYSLCERYEIEVETTHDALADAYLTALLFLHIK